MTPREASCVIGCSESHVRTLIRRGRLRALRLHSPAGYGYRYDVPTKEAERYRDTPQPGGYPRGQPRQRGAS